MKSPRAHLLSGFFSKTLLAALLVGAFSPANMQPDFISSEGLFFKKIRQVKQGILPGAVKLSNSFCRRFENLKKKSQVKINGSGWEISKSPIIYSKNYSKPHNFTLVFPFFSPPNKASPSIV